MALVKCPECGNAVSDRAESCPKCAYPMRRAAQTQVRAAKIQVTDQSVNRHKPWLKFTVLVIAALTATLFAPTLVLWFGIALLILCIGAYLQTGANFARLSERMSDSSTAGRIGSHALTALPIIQAQSRRLLRLNFSDKWRNSVRVALCMIVGFVFILAGWTVVGHEAELERVAATEAAANAQVVTLATEAETALKANNLRLVQAKLDAASKIPNATEFASIHQLRTRLANTNVTVLIAEAIRDLNAGNIETGHQKVRQALAVSHADALSEARKLDQQIRNATDPTLIRSTLMELPDEPFQRLMESGTMPMQLLSGYECLDRRTAELAKAEVEQVAHARENRRLAQIDVEQKRLEVARLAEEAAAREAKAERNRQEEARRAARVAARKAEEKANGKGGTGSIERGGTGYIEVEGENEVWVSVNETAQSELNAFSSARNEDAISQMMQQGRVLVCSKGTKVSIVDPGFFSTTIRIMDGKHSGMTGIVPNEFLHK